MAPPATAALGYAIFFILLTSAICPVATGCFESIISFGDSLADTGNLLRLSQSSVVKPRCSRIPYGETFFHRPTGRYSDGRLVVDFLAESFGLPLLQPSVGGENSNLSGQSFEKGVNFAVAGATALDHEYLEARGIYNPLTNASLGVQMDWLKRFLGTRQDGKRYVQKSLILLGEIGGNDYNHALTLGMNLEVLQSLVPTVVEYIGSTLVELIKLGAETMLVPGNFPIGCAPVHLTQFKSDDETDYYDPQTGCINWLNEFSRYHNGLLEKELNRIRELHPRISIIYADYYNAAMQFFISPNEFGFGKGSVLSACCGGGGLYNYNVSVLCSFPSATCCEDPSLYVSWDGVHLTEAAYRFLAQGLLEGNYTVPQLSTICSPSSRIPGFYEF
ncbi:GDSL esterase/lipase At1g28580-like isoform X1 [Primulina tabacum]|uniref:GDSL esterase/lipase At1g28580-like isoform X1 n=1 Tax=Primulina tabacum TaxID=48773 RepID=UPI003F59686D